MSITEVWPAEKNSGSLNKDGLTAQAEIYARTDDPEDTGIAVLAHLINNGYDYGDEYKVGNDTVTGSRLFSIGFPQLISGSATVWKTLVQYKHTGGDGNEGTGDDPNNPAQSPLDLRPKIITSSVPRQEPVQLATYLGGYNDLFTGLVEGEQYPITNSALVTFLPRPKKQVSNDNIRIEVNLPSVCLDEDEYPKDWINSKKVTLDDGRTKVVAEPYTLRFLRWATAPHTGTDKTQIRKGGKLVANRVDYVRVTLEMERKKAGWDLEILDQGTQAVTIYPGTGTPAPDGRGGNAPAHVDGTPDLRRLTDAVGNAITEPVPFNGRGGPKDPAPRYDFVYAKWRIYNLVDVAGIPLLAKIATTEEPKDP